MAYPWAFKTFTECLSFAQKIFSNTVINNEDFSWAFPWWHLFIIQEHPALIWMLFHGWTTFGLGAWSVSTSSNHRKAFISPQWTEINKQRTEKKETVASTFTMARRSSTSDELRSNHWACSYLSYSVQQLLYSWRSVEKRLLCLLQVM